MTASSTRADLLQPSAPSSEILMYDDFFGSPVTMGLATSPVAVASVVVSWVASGLVVAALMARRGHDGRVMGALGVVLGPLMMGLALDTVRHNENQARPVRVATGAKRHGSVDVLVGLLGAPESVEEALPFLRLIGDDLGHVTVATTIDFESAEAGERTDASSAALRDLQRASALLSRHVVPSTVLLPGRPERAMTAYCRESPHDVVVVVGAPARLAGSVCRELSSGGESAVHVPAPGR